MWVLTRCSVGVYNPLGVDSAIDMSAYGRTVSVGLPEPGSETDDFETWVIEERNSGHSIIAFDSVLSKYGRYVNFVT